MKTIRLKLLTLMSVIGMILPIASQAYDFSSDGIYYNILSEEDRTVEVTGYEYDRYSGNISIPPKVIYSSKSYSVTTIEKEAFYQSYINSVVIPGSVTTIGESAFQSCTSLKSVDIPNSVTRIEQWAFCNCTSLKSVVIPNSVTTIRIRAFYNCSGLTSVDIPSSVTTIEKEAFSMCTGLTSVDIPSSVTTIEQWAFSMCTGLTSVVIPNSVTTIEKNAFFNCSGLSVINVHQDNPVYISLDGILYSKKNGVATTLEVCPAGKKGIIKIPSSVTTIGSDAFSHCTGLTSVDIPNSVTTIGHDAFSYCTGLTSVDIPNSVTTIGLSAFSGCTGLKSVDIPSSVTEIGGYAFDGVNNLEKIYCHWEEPVKSSNIFEDEVLKNATLYVPIGTKVNYEKVDPWRNFWNIEEGDYEATSGINDIVHSSEADIVEVNRYDVSGKPVSKDYKGMVIIRYSDGSIRKQIVK